jgi:transposase
MMLSVTKTDIKDAKLIALYGQRMQPEVYELPKQILLALKHKRTLFRQLKKQHVALLNTQHAYEKSPYVDKSTQKILQQCILNLEEQLKKLKQEMIGVVEKEYEHLLQKVTSVAGIGKQVGAALIEITNGFKDFSCAKKFSRFIGLCPTVYQSGKSLKIQGRIARSGDPDLRALLFMCSMTAIKYNQACKAFYLHLKQKGKASKLALVAVANKLLRQVFAVVKQDQDYVNGYISKTNLT